MAESVFMEMQVAPVEQRELPVPASNKGGKGFRAKPMNISPAVGDSGPLAATLSFWDRGVGDKSGEGGS
jgi:hypothetical protein